MGITAITVYLVVMIIYTVVFILAVRESITVDYNWRDWGVVIFLYLFGALYMWASIQPERK